MFDIVIIRSFFYLRTHGNCPHNTIIKFTHNQNRSFKQIIFTVLFIPPQLDHKQPITIPQQSAQPAAADQWRPDPEEEAAIRAAELAESQRSAQQPAPRQRRERGGLGLE